MEQIASHLVLTHFTQRWCIDMQAHCWLHSAVGDFVYVPRTKGPHTCIQLPDPRNDPRRTVPHFGVPFGEHAPKCDECAGAAAVVVPVGALAG